MYFFKKIDLIKYNRSAKYDMWSLSFNHSKIFPILQKSNYWGNATVLYKALRLLSIENNNTLRN